MIKVSPLMPIRVNAHEEECNSTVKARFRDYLLILSVSVLGFPFCWKKTATPLIQYVSHTFADAECLPQLQERKMYYKTAVF